MTLEPARAQPNHEAMDDVADWAVEHPEINNKPEKKHEPLATT